jgi:signal transduction histidine kinase
MQFTRRSLVAGCALAAAFFTLSAAAQNAEHGTKEEAKIMAAAAVAHIKKVGVEKAMKDFTEDKANWTKKDLYVFGFDLKGNLLGHGANPKLVGKNLMDLKDQNGKFFIREIIEVTSTKGSGWIEYDWTNPVAKKVEGKATYVTRIPGFEGGVAVGVYR